MFFEAVLHGLHQVTVVLDRFVKVWNGSLEDVFDGSLDEEMLFCSKLRVVEVAHCL